MNTVAGVVEVAGNSMAIVAASVWACVAWKRNVKIGAVLLASIAVWAVTNVFYGLAYIGRVEGWFGWWDTDVEQVVKAVQQLTQISTPAAGIVLLAVFVRDRRVLAR